jgi:hypothetical protein
MKLELSLLKGALALIKAVPEEALDSIGTRSLFIERSSLVADTISPRAQHTVQPQATSIDKLTKKVRNERGFRRHREERISRWEHIRSSSTMAVATTGTMGRTARNKPVVNSVDGNDENKRE